VIPMKHLDRIRFQPKVPRIARRNSGGFALIVAILLMVALSFVGVAALRNVSLQERMAGNSYYRTIATHESEAGLRLVRQKLEDAWINDAIPASGSTSALSSWDGLVNKSSIAFFTAANSWSSVSAVTSLSSTRPVAVKAAIEQKTGQLPLCDEQSKCPADFFRTSARANDSATGANVITQEWSMFPK